MGDTMVKIQLSGREIFLIGMTTGFASALVFLMAYAFWGQVIADTYNAATALADPWAGCIHVLLGILIGFGVSIAATIVAGGRSAWRGLLVASAFALLFNLLLWTVIAYIYAAPLLAGYGILEAFAAFPRVLTNLASDVPGGIIFFWVYMEFTYCAFLMISLKVLGVERKVKIVKYQLYQRRNLRKGALRKSKRVKNPKIKRVKVKKPKVKRVKKPKIPKRKK